MRALRLAGAEEAGKARLLTRCIWRAPQAGQVSAGEPIGVAQAVQNIT
jgi:hypothetical protein